VIAAVPAEKAAQQSALIIMFHCSTKNIDKNWIFVVYYSAVSLMRCM
jgi:hypothetical protein